MGADVRLALREYLIKTNTFFLTTDAYNDAEDVFFEDLIRDGDPNELAIKINQHNGEVLCVVLRRFHRSIDQAVASLRDNPLPWTFSWSVRGIREKPLEDVLLAVYREYKDR